MSADKLPPLVLAPPRIPSALAHQIRVVGLDVDGVLTDGGVYLGSTRPQARHGGSPSNPAPFELKRFDIQDGVGIQLLKDAGITLVIITGRVSDSVAMRAAELGITHVVQDARAQKLSALTQLLTQLECTLDECAFVGDDLPDLAVLRAVGLPVAVGNAVTEVRRAATLQLHARGGFGAIREFAEALLMARQEWDVRVEAYVAARSTVVTT